MLMPAGTKKCVMSKSNGCGRVIGTGSLVVNVAADLNEKFLVYFLLLLYLATKSLRLDDGRAVR